MKTYSHILLKKKCLIVTVRRGKVFQFSSVTQSCPTLCDPMDCSTPGFPVLYQLPELAQTHAGEGNQ